MKSKNDWFIGRWQTSNEDSDIIIEIRKVKKQFHVRAFDKDDNEELIVSNIKWNGNLLQFETFVPSTKFRTRNCLKIRSRTKLIQELTFFESWKKIKKVIKPKKRKVVAF